jgi:DnaD/phage-associated family protein
MQTLEHITLTPQETGKLLAAGSGDAALLYLYMKASGDYSLQNAEKELRMNAQTLGWAETLLKRLGLRDIAVVKARYDKNQAPVYTGEEVTAFSAKDPSFSLLQGEISRRLGRILTTEELKTLLAIRDYLKMPPEVVSMALTYCSQKVEYYNQTHGKARTLSMRTLEKECYDWANRGILTMEQASAYISHSTELLAPEAQVKKLLGLDRPLVDSERQYIQSWLNLGFDLDAIRQAYEKTVLATGKLAWRYMNKILLNWHEKNLHTGQQVAQEGKKQPTPEVKSFTPGEGERAAVSNLQKFRDSLKE